MLVSGLWKLAAMAGVIGVGLVAVYQAQQGMEKTSVTAPDSGGGADPETTSDVLADTGQTTSEPNPFEKDPFGGVGLTDPPPTKPESRQNDGATATLSAPGVAPEQDPFGTSEFSDKTSVPVNTPETTAKARTGPGLDFRNDTAAATPAETVPSDNPIQQTGFEEEPATLPADLDAFEAQVKQAAERAKLRNAAAVKPFVRQAREAEVKEASTDPAGSADPFETNPAANAQPAESVPIASETDPFAVTEKPATTDKPAPTDKPQPTPAKVPATLPTDFPDFPATKPAPAAPATPDTDPFSDVPTGKPSTGKPPAVTPVAAPTLGSPEELKSLPGDKLPEPLDDLSSPFSTDEPPAKAKPEPAPIPDPIFPTDEPRKRLPSKLPTEIPESDPGFPGDPSSNRVTPDRVPPRDRIPERQPLPERTTPTRQPADNLPGSLDNDLLGDGTISSTSPRGVQQARLTIEKVAPPQATLGEPLVYSVIIKNIGGNDAHQVVVEDRIPKGTELTGTAPRAEMIDKKLIWRIGTLKANEEKKISIRVIPRQEGSIGSVARVNFATEVAAEIMVAAPQLSFTAKAPRQAKTGEVVEMTFLLKNTGSSTANNISVRDIVPPELKHDAASDIECPIGKLAPNETREIVLTVTAIKPGRATNRAILTGDGGISQELETSIDVIGEQLVLTRSGQTKIYIDRPAVFTNSIRNGGATAVKQIRIAEVVPAGMEFVEASDGGRFDPVQRTIVWDLPGLSPGAETAVSSKLVARSPGSVQSKVSASGPAGSSAAVKADIDVVGRPELQIETVGRTGSVAVGDRLTSRIQLKNHGSAAARNVAMNIRLPRELKLVEVRGGQYTVRDNVISFDVVNSISPNETAAFELVMEAVAEADAQMNLEISADHLSKPARRSETVQIASEVR